MKRTFWHLAVSSWRLAVSVCILGCAKKELPPSPDRFAPRLKEVNTVNRTRVELIFDEAILFSDLNSDNFLITSQSASGEETLTIRSVGIGRKENIVTLITQIQDELKLYRLSGRVKDTEGNLRVFSTKFLGSSKPDTIGPRIVALTPKPGSVKMKRILGSIRFSEEIDTDTLKASNNTIILPKSLKERFLFKLPNNRLIEFNLKDSMGLDTIGYLIFLPNLTDFDGNRLQNSGWTFWTADSVLKTDLVQGKINYEDKPIANSLILFSDTVNTLAGVLSDKDGNFAIRIKRRVYNVLALADTNFDYNVDLKGFLKDFNTEKESLDLILEKEAKPENYKNYIK